MTISPQHTDTRTHISSIVEAYSKFFLHIFDIDADPDELVILFIPTAHTCSFDLCWGFTKDRQWNTNQARCCWCWWWCYCCLYVCNSCVQSEDSQTILRIFLCVVSLFRLLPIDGLIQIHSQCDSFYSDSLRHNLWMKWQPTGLSKVTVVSVVDVSFSCLHYVHSWNGCFFFIEFSTKCLCFRAYYLLYLLKWSHTKCMHSELGADTTSHQSEKDSKNIN